MVYDLNPKIYKSLLVRFKRRRDEVLKSFKRNLKTFIYMILWIMHALVKQKFILFFVQSLNASTAWNFKCMNVLFSFQIISVLLLYTHTHA